MALFEKKPAEKPPKYIYVGCFACRGVFKIDDNRNEVWKFIKILVGRSKYGNGVFFGDVYAYVCPDCCKKLGLEEEHSIKE
jgi:hypothetical protein